MRGVLAGHQLAHQGLLEAQLQRIFPGHNILHNTKKASEITNPHTGAYLEVDLWLPDINLCFEFQDDYHYTSSWYAQVPLGRIQQKDNTKRNLLLERGHTLIVVPYWWDCKFESLCGTIHFHRPDLMLQYESEIPANPSVLVSDNKNLMLAAFPRDSGELDLDRNSWWIGEKWDGVRCFWDTKEKKLYTRYNGNIEWHQAADSFVDHLELDSELWYGRRSFHETQKFCTSSWGSLDSSFLRMVCFDEASAKTHNKTYEERYELILSHLPADYSTIIVAARAMSTSEKRVMEMLQGTLAHGGEGLILQLPQSRYSPGRSCSLFKVKASYCDQEALVVEVERGGFLLLQRPNGSTFKVAAEDWLLQHNASKGDVVTVGYGASRHMLSIEDVVGGEPANAEVQTIRTDVTWEDVVRSAVHDPMWSADLRDKPWHTPHYKQNKQALLFPDHDESKDSNNTPWKSVRNRRAYFDNFAHAQGIDPLNPTNWYSVTPMDLLRYRTGYWTISGYYDGKLSTTLMQLYPDIGLQKSLFKAKTQSWNLQSSRRAYFDQFAAFKGIDPLNPISWYGVTTLELLEYHNGYSAISDHYGGKLTAALMDLYPNIGLQLSNFKAKQGQSWKHESKRRAFFDQFANSKNMDPLNPVFWYGVTLEALIKYHSGVPTILAQYHGNSLSSALMLLYPDIGLQKHRFKVKKQSFKRESDRRTFFDQYAAARAMDPLNPIFWYNVTWRDLTNYSKGLSTVYLGKHLPTTLIKLYPNIGLQRAEFKGKSSWKQVSDRRAYFDAFAASKGRDPLNPDFWYSVTMQEVIKYHPGFEGIALHEGGKYLSKILLRLYPEIGLVETSFKVKKKRQVPQIASHPL